MRKSMAERDEGFTLIELLVVIIIIGILAAIAIPTFLSQRKKGWDASSKSALRNAATAQESYFTDNSTYIVPGATNKTVSPASSAATAAAALKEQGYNDSASTALTIISASNSAYCMKADTQGQTWYLNSTVGAPSTTVCT